MTELDIPKSSLTLIKEFLSENNVNINPKNYLEDYIINKNNHIALKKDIIHRIIIDSYKSSNKLVKKISEKIMNEFKIFLGRVQKSQLKKYIDYQNREDFEIFYKSFRIRDQTKENIQAQINHYIAKYDKNSYKVIESFVDTLKKEIERDSHSRIQRSLLFLYSLLINLNENRKSSLKELFEMNDRLIKKELSEKDYNLLKMACNSTEIRNRKRVVDEFNQHYLKIFQMNEKYEEKYSIIYFEINQDLLDEFNSKDVFYSYLFQLVSRSYNDLKNHRSLIIRIKNVIYGQINMKWEIYVLLTIFTERFLKKKEIRQYYFPKEIFRDIFEYLHKKRLNETEITQLKMYYREKITFEELTQNTEFNALKYRELIDYFKKIQTGFTFLDCFVLKTDKTYENSQEINIIKNQNELLLSFAKHKINNKKIPYPVCGSLKISGNSYSELGIKSWECKNPLCAERSKNNRGKRFSERIIFMQASTFDFSNENQISRRRNKIWRKDFVEDWMLSDLYEMTIKYFSYKEDTVAAIGIENVELFEESYKKQKRNLKQCKFNEYLEFKDVKRDFSFKFLKNDLFLVKYLNDFSIRTDNIEGNGKLLELLNDKAVNIILNDCFEVLRKLNKNSIHNMVTSPPYYNVREYSNWKNLFCYLFDMYKIIIASYNVLQEGGAFFFNIGDVYDNDNLNVKSKMGNRRIPLGAYMIFLFQKAGFELLDNIIWHKGEPQSNMHKNDGNFTPYYQLPTNCYEHVFIFKKKGKLKLNQDLKENILTNNIQKFSPVIEIFNEKNQHGHYAPYPRMIPLLSITYFTNENELVVDPFSGSGTTPITALKNNRIGLGIEIKEEFAKLSLKKASDEGLPTKLLHKNHKIILIENENLNEISLSNY